jgi:Bacterial regulatory helix-turn-helix protein, lysR family
VHSEGSTLEMHHIRYFLAVGETLNLTRAAERCNVAQPALTRAIKVLENELGGELLRRERRECTRIQRHGASGRAIGYLRTPSGTKIRGSGDDPPPSLHGHYPASTLLRGSPPLSGASVLSASRLEPLAPFPLASPARFSRSIQEPD